jgi:hypothetical protein
MPTMNVATIGTRSQNAFASPRMTTATRVKMGEFLLRLWWDRAQPGDQDHRRYRAELLRVAAVAEELSMGQEWVVLLDEGIAELCYHDGLHRATAGLSIELASGDPAEQAAAFQMLEALAAMC